MLMMLAMTMLMMMLAILKLMMVLAVLTCHVGDYFDDDGHIWRY